MRTIEKANTILTAMPREALLEVVGVCAVVVLIFSGFMIPAFL